MADLCEPLHIHVMKEKAIAKFWFDPVRLALNKGFRDHELREISDLVKGHEELIRVAGMSVYEVDIKNLRFLEDSLVFDLVDGRSISAPLAYYPTLMNASVEQRNDFEIVGHMVHWIALDVDLSSDCLLQGAKELPLYHAPHEHRAVTESMGKYKA